MKNSMGNPIADQMVRQKVEWVQRLRMASPMQSKIVSNAIVNIDHATAKVFRTVPVAAGASARDIAPDAPQQFRHHIDRQENDADREEKYPKDTAFFEQIAVACTDANCLVLIGRGHGQSNEAHHLTAYLAAHHPELSARVLPASVADLSHLTKSQLIELGYERLHAAARY